MSSDSTSIDILTQDLIALILLKLPVKPLLRCKSVCKPWLSLISNPNFINSHIKRFITTPPGERADETLIIYETDDNSMSMLNLDSPRTKTPLGFPYSRGDYSFDPDYKILGSFNGIVCVSVFNCPKRTENCDVFEWYTNNTEYHNNPSTYLWNPATKQSKLIPPHNIRENVHSVVIGFGFDPIGNDFKVLRVVVYSWDDPFSAEVYSANTNVWHMVDGPTDYPDYNEFEVCVNGFLFYEGSRGMMAFDLDKEVFTCAIQLPATSAAYCITDFNDSIATITCKEEVLKYVFMLWTLNDEACLRGGGVEASWTVVLAIDVHFPYPRVYGCLNSRDVMLFTDDDVCVLYNSHMNEARNVPVSMALGQRNIIKYNESLVSITGSKQVD